MTDDAPLFEQALTELEQILRSLEDGATTLEESLARYERGVALLKSCYAQLQAAEQRITLLAGVTEEGAPKLQPFDHTASDANSGESRRRPPRTKPRDNSGIY